MRRMRSRPFIDEFIDVAKFRDDDDETDLELPTDQPWVDPNASKTPARREFERAPYSLLRRPEKGLRSPTSLTSYDADHPVDLAWQIVCHHAHQKYPASMLNKSDPWITQAYQFLQALLDCRDDGDHAKLAQAFPDVNTAYTHYRSDDKFLRGRLEAYLLSPRPLAEAARACEISVKAVEAYEQLFFKVRDKIAHPFLVHSVAFDDKFWNGMRASDTDLLLKRAGLMGGGAMLELMIRYCSSGWRVPGRSKCVSRAKLIEFHDLLSLRALVLAWLLPPEKFGRVTIADELRQDLKKLLDGWPEGASTPQKSPFGPWPMSPKQLETWWAYWRKAVVAATRLS
jgi:hypothetical protein